MVADPIYHFTRISRFSFLACNFGFFVFDFQCVPNLRHKFLTESRLSF